MSRWIAAARLLAEYGLARFYRSTTTERAQMALASVSRMLRLPCCPALGATGNLKRH